MDFSAPQEGEVNIPQCPLHKIFSQPTQNLRRSRVTSNVKKYDTTLQCRPKISRRSHAAVQTTWSALLSSSANPDNLNLPTALSAEQQQYVQLRFCRTRQTKAYQHDVEDILKQKRTFRFVFIASFGFPCNKAATDRRTKVHTQQDHICDATAILGYKTSPQHPPPFALCTMTKNNLAARTCALLSPCPPAATSLFAHHCSSLLIFR